MSHLQDIKHWRFGLASDLSHQPSVSVFYDQGMKLYQSSNQLSFSRKFRIVAWHGGSDWEFRYLWEWSDVCRINLTALSLLSHAQMVPSHLSVLFDWLFWDHLDHQHRLLLPLFKCALYKFSLKTLMKHNIIHTIQLDSRLPFFFLQCMLFIFF